MEIAEGEKSPYVLVNPEENTFVLKGNSFMGNPPSFFEQILQWSQKFKATATFNIEVV
jgi:SiaC family regulatory phosphoprotein